MKKITKKTNILKKAFIAALLCTGLNEALQAQCNTNFTYSTTASSISATNTSTGITGNTFIYWNLANVGGSVFATSYDTLPVFTPLYNGSYVLTLSVDSTGGNCTPLSQTITINGGTNAPACSSSFTYSVGASGAVTFTNTSPVDALGHTNYSWSFGDGNTAYTSNPSYTYYYNGTYTVSLNVSNYNTGCSTSSTQTVGISNTNTPPACTSNFTYTVGTSGQVDFTNLYAGSATLDSSAIQWNFGDGQFMSDSLNATHTYAYNGTYSVTLYVNDHLANCYSSMTRTLSITNATTPPCVASVSFIMHQDSMNPQPGVWQVSTYYSPQVTSAVWSWGDGTTTTGFAPAHTYTAAGHYNICVTAYAACGDTSTVCQNDSLFRMSSGMISLTVLNVNATGIKTSVNETAQVSVYPNPSAGVFTLNLTGVSANATKAQINISNILGDVVYSTQEQVNNYVVSKEIDLQSIANGAYFMKVMIGSKSYTSKIIINK